MNIRMTREAPEGALLHSFRRVETLDGKVCTVTPRVTEGVAVWIIPDTPKNRARFEKEFGASSRYTLEWVTETPKPPQEEKRRGGRIPRAPFEER